MSKKLFFRYSITFLFFLGSLLFIYLFCKLYFAPPLLTQLKIFGEPQKKFSMQTLEEKELQGYCESIKSDFLSKKIEIKVEKRIVLQPSYKELGFTFDAKSFCDRLRPLLNYKLYNFQFIYGLKSNTSYLNFLLPIGFDRKTAEKFIYDLKQNFDLIPSRAIFDFEKKQTIPSNKGGLISPIEAMVVLENIWQQLISNQKVGYVQVPTWQESEAPDSQQQIDISFRLSAYQTEYPTLESDRTKNIKMGAERINGFILKPQEEFSFNQVVGSRGLDEGYRYAGVIQGGEMLQGEAGGMCQVASTLHAAAVFAGLDILKTTPHSRPSAYIEPGLDSTVVEPEPGKKDSGVDLKFRNPYPFPIVIHYTVGSGKAKAEIFGKRPPYKEVHWVREVKKLILPPEEEVNQEDPNMPKGQSEVVQHEHEGYYILITRTRVPINLEQPPRIDKISKYYPPTKRIVMHGTGPVTLPKKKIVVHKSRSIPKEELPPLPDDKNLSPPSPLPIQKKGLVEEGPKPHEIIHKFE